MPALTHLIPDTGLPTRLWCIGRSATADKPLASSASPLAPIHYRGGAGGGFSGAPGARVSCDAFFKRWLLESRLPCARSRPTTFPTRGLLGALEGNQGCFPLDVTPLRVYV